MQNRFTERIAFFCFFLLLSVLFFNRAFLEHRLIAPGDGWLEHYPLKLYYAKEFFHHGIHLWLPYLFLGLPFLGTLQTGLLYPLNAIYFLIPTPIAYNLSLILYYALAGYFTFLYCRLLGAGKLPAVLAGMTFAFPGFLMSHKQHPSMVAAGAWLPLILYFYEKIRRDRRIEDALWASLVVAIQLLAGHFQICFYGYIILLLFTIFFVFGVPANERIRFLILCALPLILGMLASLPQIIATKELAALNFHVNLGLNTARIESFHPYLLLTFIFPFLFGGGYTIPYSAQGYLIEFLGFTGICALVIALITIVTGFKRDLRIRFWSGIGALALFLMIGGQTPLAPFILKIPILHSFRALSRNIFEFDLAIAVLFALGYETCLRYYRKWVCFAFLFVFIFEFVVLAGKSIWIPFLNSAFSIKSPTFWIPAAFTLIYLLWFSVMPKAKTVLTAVVLIGLFGCEAFFCQSAFDTDWPSLSAPEMLMNHPVLQYLSRHTGGDRFVYYGDFETYSYAGLPIVNCALQSRLLNGYDPLFPQSVQNLLDVSYLGYFFHAESLFRNNLILSLLAARYVVVPPDSKLSVLGSFYGLPSFHKNKIESVKTIEGPFVLQSPDGRQVNVVKEAIPFYPNAAYQISLEAKSGQPLEAQLVLDLFAKDFHSPDTQLVIFPEGIGGDFQRYSKLIFAPAKLSGPLLLRVYTFSKKPIQIRKIQIDVIKHYQPFFMRTQKTAEPFYKKVFQSEDFVIYENQNVLPRLFSIKTIESIHTLNEMKEKLYLLQANPLETGFMLPEDETGFDPHARFSIGHVDDFKEETDQIEADVTFPGTGFLVLSDQYFPGWKAFIDDRETKIFLIDGALRGIMVPAGKHVIVFRYCPQKIYWASLIGVLTVAGVFMALLFMKRKSRMSFFSSKLR